MLSVNCREGEPLYFISEKIVYDRKNLHIMIRVVTLLRCLTRRCAGFFVPGILLVIRKVHRKEGATAINNKILKIAYGTISFLNIVYFKYYRMTL